MFKFSCFHVNVQGNKTKKIAQPSTEAMAKATRESSKSPVSKDLPIHASLNSLHSKQHSHKLTNVSENDILDQDSVERIGNLEDLNCELCIEFDRKNHQTGRLKKSQSLESGLCEAITEGDQDVGFSKSGNDSTNSIGSPNDECQADSNFEFQVIPGRGIDGPIFSIGDLSPLDKDIHKNPDTPLSGDYAGDSAEQTSVPSTPCLMKSCSLPNINVSTISSANNRSFKNSSSMSRSSDDLCALGMRKKEVFINDSYDQIQEVLEGENGMEKTENTHMDRYFDDGFDSHQLRVEKDWIAPITDDISDDVKLLQGDSSIDCSDDFPNKDFKVKRIEDWVIGLQHCAPPLEDINELPESAEPVVDVNTVNSATASVVDHKITPEMEAAKRYISSLTANATAAQLANHGLVVIPFLSAFVSLKVLNLSGNAIARITAGSLPRGLHTLNLSKNNISTIEGLRELTRLRVLDLSYNRILRIGHGLASCSSLKELYLAGNKIGEVEGLHRLLKLSILDIRFNKISTAKCLGQLAANYNSLLAIYLEGNPCLKNVGDEQIKKYLQSLLPHLVYYNRQPFKASGMKDSADRAVRLGMISQQFDRSLRVDRKPTRKAGNHGLAAAQRPSSVSTPKLSKRKQAQLPPIRTKTSIQSRNPSDSPSKVLSLNSGQRIRKSRSEGTLPGL